MNNFLKVKVRCGPLTLNAYTLNWPTGPVVGLVILSEAKNPSRDSSSPAGAGASK